MVDNKKEKKSRGFFPDSLIAKRIDFEGFAFNLVKKMGFANSKKPTKPSRPERPYSYEDTGIINDSINQTLSMFPESYGNIKPSQQATVIPLSSSTQQAAATHPHEIHTDAFQPVQADTFQPKPMDVGGAHENIIPIDTPTDQTPSVFTPPKPEQEDAESPQLVPLSGLVSMSQISSRWELVSTEIEFDEEPEPEPKKKRFKFFGSTRGAHIRFIVIVLGVILVYMLILGFLSYRGMLDIGI
jgi:hypothetical protein